MAENNTTRGYPLPHPDNIAREDAQRIRDAIEQISTDIDDLDGGPANATETATGGVRLATAAEATAGSTSASVPVVARVKAMITTAVNALSTTVTNLVNGLSDEIDVITTALDTKASKAANLTDLTDKVAARAALGVATSAQIRSKANALLVTNDLAWDAAAWVNLGNITGSVVIDASTGSRFYGAMTGNCTFTVINGKSGQSLEVVPMQGPAGNCTVSWGSMFFWPAGTAPGFNPAANTVACVVTGVVWFDGINVFGAGWKLVA